MLTPQQIIQNRYQLEQQLGNKVSRQTWLAQDLETNKSVVVKLLPLSPQMEWDDLKLFQREASVLKHLNHRQIPKYLDDFSLDAEVGEGLIWFVLVQEYIPGVSLQDQLNQGKKFTEERTKEIAKQLLTILMYLHQLSPPVLHRDIKPSNIIEGQDGRIYLVDFGAVQERAKSEGVTFTVVGTEGYTPPEQFWGRAVPASDLYALGATLIHLVTGISPSHSTSDRVGLKVSDTVQLNYGFVCWLEKLTDPYVEHRFSQAKQALSFLLESSKKIPIKIEQSSLLSMIPERYINNFLIQFILIFFVGISILIICL